MFGGTDSCNFLRYGRAPHATRNFLPDVGAIDQDPVVVRAPAFAIEGGYSRGPVSVPLSELGTNVDHERQRPVAEVQQRQHLRGRHWSGVSRCQELKIRVSAVRFRPWPLPYDLESANYGISPPFTQAAVFV
jgi:hypothetical protein